MNIDSTYVQLSEDFCTFELPTDALANQTIVISGATGGLGTALSKACAAAGATVVLCGRNIKKLEALYDCLEGIDGAPQPAIITLNQEMATEAEYEHITQILENEFGYIDTLVHAAAELGNMTPLNAIAQKDWSRVMAVNLSSARLLTNACMPLLTASDKASVLFTLDEKVGAYWGAYGISKSALASYVRMLADENEHRINEKDGAPRVAINGIDPGPMRTPLRRKAFPGELEGETAPPEKRLAPFLALISRHDRQLNGATLQYRD